MKKLHVLLIVAIAILVGTIVALTFNTSTYGTFADAQLNSGEECRIAGTLDRTQPLIYNPETDPNICSFYLVDKEGKSNKVVLHQSKPRDIEKSGNTDEIVVNGTLVNGEFHVKANDIQLKCPSKYNKDVAVAGK